MCKLYSKIISFLIFLYWLQFFNKQIFSIIYFTDIYIVALKFFIPRSVNNKFLQRYIFIHAIKFVPKKKKKWKILLSNPEQSLYPHKFNNHRKDLVISLKKNYILQLIEK